MTRRRFLESAAGGALLSAALPGTRSASNQAGGQLEERTKKPLGWKSHEVARIPSGYQVAVADVNGDGKLDIMALSSEQPIVEWYENPTWKAGPITIENQHNISLAPLFKNAYPLRGIALASDFDLNDSEHGGTLSLAEPGFTPGGPWPLRHIGQIPTSHRLRWADLDGDGRLELIDVPILGPGAKAPDYAAGAPLTWFDPPELLLSPHAEPGPPPRSWTSHLIDNTLTVIHGINVLDWDHDGRDEFLTASFEGVHLFKPSGKAPRLTWSRTHLGAGDQVSSPRRGSSEIGAGRLWGRRFLATIEPWHGEQVAVYLEGPPAELWTRHVIDMTFHDGHALACADLDGDGNDEIIAGFRGPGTSLYVYYASDSSGIAWDRQTLDGSMAASGLAIADINGDGRLDIVAVGSSTANVMWYENLG